MTFWCLVATAALGIAFLVAKGFEYHDDIVKGLVPGPDFTLREPGAQIFWAFYWIVTGVHAIHLTVGIGVVANGRGHAPSAQRSAARARHSKASRSTGTSST